MTPTLPGSDTQASEKNPMIRPTLFVAVVLASVACSEPTGPKTTSGEIQFSAVSSTRMLASQEGDVPELPTIDVHRKGTLHHVAQVQVTFVLESPDGKSATVTVVSNASGKAMLPAWHLGTEIGLYTATAMADGVSTHVQFTASVRGAITAVFDLRTVDGKPLQQGEWTEGHVVLFEDGTFNKVYNATAESALTAKAIDGTYKRIDNSIQFFAPSWSIVPYALLINGTLDRGNLTLVYLGIQALEFPPEVYSER
jgi:hypothetical protein